VQATLVLEARACRLDRSEQLRGTPGHVALLARSSLHTLTTESRAPQLSQNMAIALLLRGSYYNAACLFSQLQANRPHVRMSPASRKLLCADTTAAIHLTENRCQAGHDRDLECHAAVWLSGSLLHQATPTTRTASTIRTA